MFLYIVVPDEEFFSTPDVYEDLAEAQAHRDMFGRHVAIITANLPTSEVETESLHEGKRKLYMVTSETSNQKCEYKVFFELKEAEDFVKESEKKSKLQNRISEIKY